jgi:hypothetical protein
MNTTIDMKVVRIEAAAFKTLSHETCAVIREAIPSGQSRAYYEGGYNAAMYGMALAMGSGIENAGYTLAVTQVVWAYAAEIVKMDDMEKYTVT